MAVTHSNAALSAATDAVTALIGTSGSLVFRLAGTVLAPGTVVATLALSATAFPASTNGLATANAITTNTNVTGNASPVANASLQTSGGTLVIHCAVAATGSDINMTNWNGGIINAGDTVSCSSLTYKSISA